MSETAERKPVAFARVGELVVNVTGKVFRVERQLSRVNYLVTDEDGKQWRLRRTATYAAPEGTVWNGPATSVFAEQERAMALAAQDFRVGDTVEMVNPKDRQKFPGHFIITKRTTATRFGLVGVGTGIQLTSPAALIQKVTP